MTAWRSPYALTATTTDVAGRPVRAFEAGSPVEGADVVLVPGLGAPGYLAPWARAIATWTRVALLDLPGWRAGRATSSGPSLDGVADATAGWLEATGRTGVVLAGHSTGAQSVLRTALQVPGRVAGVVLAGPTFDPAARTVPALLRRIAATIVHERPGELLAVGPSYLSSGGLPLLRFVGTALPDRPEDLLPRLGAPVLVVTGRRDGLAPPPWARRLASLAGGACVVIPGAHNAPFTHPAAADAVLRDFALRHRTATR